MIVCILGTLNMQNGTAYVAKKHFVIMFVIDDVMTREAMIGADLHNVIIKK